MNAHALLIAIAIVSLPMLGCCPVPVWEPAKIPGEAMVPPPPVPGRSDDTDPLDALEEEDELETPDDSDDGE